MTKAPTAVEALREIERLSFEAPPNSLTPRIAAVARAALSTAEREAEVKAMLVEALESIKEFLDDDETQLAWKAADDALKAATGGAE